MRELIVSDSYPRFQFRLRTLLTALTLVAVGFGAYLFGHEKGYHHGWHIAADSCQSKILQQSARISALEKERDAFAARADQE